MKKNFFTKFELLIVMAILTTLAFLAFKAIDPAEKIYKTKDDAKLNLVNLIGQSGSFTLPSEVPIPPSLKNENLDKIISHKTDSVTGEIIIYSKLESRANYSRCNSTSDIAWAVYSSTDDHTGIVCTTINSEPIVGNQTYLP
ncbi:hypothetical protein BH10PAT1_BH10PAT1_4350 [soil metagenome]